MNKFKLSVVAALIAVASFALPALAAQQTVTIQGPVGATCPPAPDPIYTTVTSNTVPTGSGPSCTVAAASSVVSAQGNTITNTLLSDNARQLIDGLCAQGWLVTSTPFGQKHWRAGGSNVVVSNSAANFIPADGLATPQATLEGDVSSIVANVAIVHNLKCVLTTTAGVVTVAGGTSYVIALDQNLVASPITCTILAAASSCVDTTHAITTAIGDQLDYVVTPAGTPTALVVKCAVEGDI